MLIDTAAAEFAESCPLSLPLPPHDAVEFVAEPLVEFLERAFNVGPPLEVRRPTPDNGGQVPAWRSRDCALRQVASCRTDCL
jgi:hypothetical protein